jgi:hypothetical protein
LATEKECVELLGCHGLIWQEDGTKFKVSPFRTGEYIKNLATGVFEIKKNYFDPFAHYCLFFQNQG